MDYHSFSTCNVRRAWGSCVTQFGRAQRKSQSDRPMRASTLAHAHKDAWLPTGQNWKMCHTGSPSSAREKTLMANCEAPVWSSRCSAQTMGHRSPPPFPVGSCMMDEASTPEHLSPRYVAGPHESGRSMAAAARDGHSSLPGGALHAPVRRALHSTRSIKRARAYLRSVTVHAGRVYTAARAVW